MSELITTEPDKNHPHYKLLKRLHNFYKAHPAMRIQYSREIEEIRAECSALQEKLQQEFDKEFNEITGIYMLKEAEYLREKYPGEIGYGVIGALKNWLK